MVGTTARQLPYSPALSAARKSTDRDDIADLELHQVLARNQRAIIGAAGFRDQIINRGRWNRFAREEYQMGKGRQLWPGLRKHAAGVIGHRMMCHNALDEWFREQFRPRDCDFVNEKVGARTVPDDIAVKARIA